MVTVGSTASMSVSASGGTPNQLPVVRWGKWEYGRSDCGRDSGQLHDPAADEHDELLGTGLEQPRHR
jgi:hypothetical protein